MQADHRLARLRELIASKGVDALAAETPSNVIYLTGFDGVFDPEPSSVCVVTASDACVHVDSRFVEAARAEAEGTPWRVEGPCVDVWASVVTALDRAGANRVGLDAEMPHHRYSWVADTCAAEVTPADSWVESLREVKDAAEIARIADACAIADAAFDHILGFVKPGVTEADIALELEVTMRRGGSRALAFASIVASGPNSSRPHAQVSDRAIERGDFLTMDFGARVGGYCSDMTRTVVVGKASDAQREVYGAVLAANEAGIAAVRAGRTGAEIDAVARGVIASAGWGENFGHGLGHGLGLDVHEGPRVSPKGAAPVRLGAVVTIEPGVYVPGVGGARIEDLVVVGEAGATVLTRSPKHLIEL